MSLVMKLSQSLVKTESTYGVDPTPSASADGVVLEDVSPSFPNEVIDPEPSTGTLTKPKPLHGRKLSQLEFSIPIKGSGTAGTAPEWGPLLEACGFQEFIVASTSVTYAPRSTGVGSVTIYYYMDGLLYEMNGCRGTVAFDFTAGQRGMMNFTMTGHPVAPVDAAIPAVSNLDLTVPPIVRSASFTIGGYAGVVAQVTCDMQCQVVPNDSVNGTDGYGEVFISNRQPQGSINPEITLVATHDWWAEWEDGDANTLSLTLGATAGNIATFTGLGTVYRELGMEDRSGVAVHSIPISFSGAVGNDDINLVLT